MRAILIDDEPLALTHLAEELQHLSEIEVIGTFRSPKQALKHILQEQPEVVFLDIEMPEMSGIELAEHILQQLPNTHIVFVTVFDDYAVKAFELNSLDYLLKPLQTERLAKTISRLNSAATGTVPATDPVFKIHCFGCLKFEQAGQPKAAVRWKTFRAQELFCFLLQNRGKPVRKEVLLERLWPGVEWKRGVTQLYTAIYQIRKQLQAEYINIQISNLEEGYMLELNGAVVDIETWEKQLAVAPALNEFTLATHLQIASLYKGDYFGEYAFEWAEMERTRLRVLWVRHIRLLAGYYMDTQQNEEAVALYLKVQRVLPNEESIYFELMQLYNVMGERRSVEYQYELLARMLRRDMDMVPHPKVQRWFEAWKEEGPGSADTK
ncbi:response regulator [Paenibacillus sp. GCM10012306]|uniref:response regulator n=1 Tax=Paenibacillus sp. GCM10012306 TaxID=3317342 RepID=UPI003619D10D